ncbi:unnamed protein product [Trichobilharzia regenti]|nr:unnamed protein product [Trichobilharzia regenti]
MILSFCGNFLILVDVLFATVFYYYYYDISIFNELTFPNYGRIFWGIHVMNLETNSLIINSRSNNCCSQALMNSPPGNLQYPRHLRFPDNFFDVLCPDRVFSEGKPILKLACSSVEFSRLTNLFHGKVFFLFYNHYCYPSVPSMPHFPQVYCLLYLNV